MYGRRICTILVFDARQSTKSTIVRVEVYVCIVKRIGMRTESLTPLAILYLVPSRRHSPASHECRLECEKSHIFSSRGGGFSPPPFLSRVRISGSQNPICNYLQIYKYVRDACKWLQVQYTHHPNVICSLHLARRMENFNFIHTQNILLFVVFFVT